MQAAWLGPASAAPPAASAQNAIEAVDTVYLDVDTMKTFWESKSGEPAGAVSVPGTTEITPVVGAMKKIALADPKGKAVTARDTRHPSENKTYSQFGKTGPEGDEPIAESQVFAQDQQLKIPHLREEKGQLVPAPFDRNAHTAAFLDPNVELVFEKSGKALNPATGAVEGAYSIANNPHFNEIMSTIKPKRYVVWGVCTDFCVDRSVIDLLKVKKNGVAPEIIVISDGIAGENPVASQLAIQHWKSQGVKLMTAREYVESFRPELIPVLEQATRVRASGAECLPGVLNVLRRAISNLEIAPFNSSLLALLPQPLPIRLFDPKHPRVGALTGPARRSDGFR